MPLLKSRGEAPVPDAEVPAPPDILLTTLRTGATAAARRAAALDLAGSPDSAEALAGALGQEPASVVREAIVTALVEIGTVAAAHSLAQYFRGEDVELRNAAVEALRQIGDASALAMKERLESPDPDERIFAIGVLEGLRHTDTAAWLRHVLLHDPDMKVGLAAVEALVQAGEAEDAAALRGFATRFPDEPFVAFAVRLACERVAGQARA